MATQGLLDQQVIVITGSTRGIGRAIAEACAAEGARVVINGRSAERGGQVVEAIRQRGGEAMLALADVGSEADVRGMFAAAMEQWGRVDGVVCNAATLDLGALDGPVTEIELESWNKLISADLTSAFLTAKHGLKAIMQGGRGGAAVMISSLAGIRGNLGHDGYSAAKGGMLALSRSIAAYYARYAIRCNCLNVGFVDSGSDRVEHVLSTPGFPRQLLDFHLGNWGKAADVANLAAFLLSDRAGYINGAEIAVDGGATAASHMPRPNVKDIPGFQRLSQRPAPFVSERGE